MTEVAHADGGADVAAVAGQFGEVVHGAAADVEDAGWEVGFKRVAAAVGGEVVLAWGV